jgi:uncharacterized iron-regulated membrane protein
MRRIILNIHLFLGVSAAFFLLILSATGMVIAFEHDIDRWLHPSLWLVKPLGRQLPEQELIRIAERTYSPARVVTVQVFSRPDVVQILQMSDRGSVYIDPWSGSIRGRVAGPTRTQKWLGYIHQLHLRLIPDPASTPSLSAPGKLIVSCAGLAMCLLVPTGFILWWRTRTTSIQWSGSWFRVFFDVHRVVGIYAFVLLFVSAFTGVLIGFDFAEKIIYSAMHSPMPTRLKPPLAEESAGRPSITVDQAMSAARNAIAGSIITQVRLPANAKSAFTVSVRTPLDYSIGGAVPIPIYVDPYSGRAVQVQDLFVESPGYRMVRLNRAIHTGDYWGTPGNILMALSSLIVGVMVVTGTIIRIKKLSGPAKRPRDAG